MSQQQSADCTMDVIGVSIPGPKHKQSGKKCQDSWASQKTKEYVIIAVGDGLGTADHSAKGSEIATQSVIESIDNKLADVNPDIMKLNRAKIKDIMLSAMLDARKDVCSVADSSNRPVEKYHTTLSVALATRSWHAAAAVGDSGLVGIKEKDKYKNLVEQENSEYENMTTPLTSKQEQISAKLRFGYDESSVVTIVAFTDGLDKFARSADDPCSPDSEFFSQIHEFVTEIDSFRSKATVSQFNQFVDNKHFHNHSKDDKTLVVGRLPNQPELNSVSSEKAEKYTQEKVC